MKPKQTDDSTPPGGERGQSSRSVELWWFLFLFYAVLNVFLDHQIYWAGLLSVVWRPAWPLQLCFKTKSSPGHIVTKCSRFCPGSELINFLLSALSKEMNSSLVLRPSLLSGLSLNPVLLPSKRFRTIAGSLFLPARSQNLAQRLVAAPPRPGRPPQSASAL